MYIKTSIFGIQHTCINFLIITKIECWPVFKQDPNLRKRAISELTTATPHKAIRIKGRRRVIEEYIKVKKRGNIEGKGFHSYKRLFDKLTSIIIV